MTQKGLGLLKPPSSGASASQDPLNETMFVSLERLVELAAEENHNVHPLLKIQALAALDKRNPETCVVRDHGTWDGRWPLPSRSDWEIMEALSLKWPTGSHEIFAVQASRKEYKWKDMDAESQKAFSEAAVKGWEVWTRTMQLMC